MVFGWLDDGTHQLLAFNFYVGAIALRAHRPGVSGRMVSKSRMLDPEIRTCRLI